MISFSPRGYQSKDIISVNKKWTAQKEVYITELREPLALSPQDKTFFVRLDAQLTEVNKFFRSKEAEYIDRARVLEKQMLALINLEEEMARRGLTTSDCLATRDDHLPAMKEGADELPLLPDGTDKSGGFQVQTFPMQASNGDREHSDDSEEGEQDTVIQDYIFQMSNLKQRRGSCRDAELEIDVPNGSQGSISLIAPGTQSPRSVRFSPVSSDGSSVLPSPRSVLKKVSQFSDDSERAHPGPDNTSAEVEEGEVPDEAGDIPEDDIENQKNQIYKSEKELNHAKRLLRLAFVEFYRGLGLLSSFRSLNMTAFAKILKKYDKTTGWNMSPIYMKEVESSYFVTSSKVHKLMNKVEELYAKHFTDGERKKAISHLRPERKIGSHRTTFFIGLFSGTSVALIISFFFLVDNKNALGRGHTDTAHNYVKNVFPIFSTLMLLWLHILCYAGNVYMWAKTRINYPFIFGFSSGTELRYREVLLLATGLSTFLLAGMNLHIGVTLLIAPEETVNEESIVINHRMVADVIPLLLVLVCLVALFLPFNILYRSSRAFFLGCFRRLASAPFVKVTLPDFFLGDQLTSQVLLFRNLQFMTCYYPTGYFLKGEIGKCDLDDVYRGFGYVVALLPFWWRFLQCLRRYYDEKDTHQLENAGKYMSAIVALELRQAYSNHENLKVLGAFSVITSIIATIYASYWDLCVDWGLLNRKSKNKWLRDKIILQRKSVYFVCIGANIVLRLAWMLSIMRLDRMLGFVQYKNAFNAGLAALEIIRRGIWNFFRIENEHLNNVGKYRAVKTVPLPFNND